MNEEKRKYIIVSSYNYYCIIIDGLEKNAIEIAEIMKKIEIDNIPRIFKIEKEIYFYQEKGQKEITEKIIIPDGRSFGGGATDF